MKFEFKTYRDIFVIIYAFFWFISNLITWLISKENFYVILSTYSFIIIMLIIIYFDKHCNKFNEWLNTKIKRNE